MGNELNTRQLAFCLEYIKDFNGVQSAIRAGYSQKGAAVQATRLLINANVQQKVCQLIEERNNKCKVDANYVLTRLKEIDDLDIIDIIEGDFSGFKPLKDWPKSWRISINSLDIKKISNASGEDNVFAVVEKIKWPDKTKNLELIGRHVNVSAFSGEAGADEALPLTINIETKEAVAEVKVTRGEE